MRQPFVVRRRGQRARVSRFRLDVAFVCHSAPSRSGRGRHSLFPPHGILEETRMDRRAWWKLPILLLAATISGGAGAADGEGEYRLTGPLASENLAVYFIHGNSSAEPVPLTLQEA